MSKLSFSVAFAVTLLCSPHASAEILFDTIGDTTFETVYEGGGDNESLASVVANYSDPVTGNPDPILAADGSLLVVGSEALGENPEFSDQSQVQRFLVTDQAESVTVRYLGLGGAGYRSIFGAYYYPSVGSFEDVVHVPLFVQNISEVGTESVFTVPADNYFGFYLNANGYHSSTGFWYSENERNSDNNEVVVTDHFLVFNTNQGIMLAIEDLPRSDYSGRLGDQDYEDLLVGFITKSNGEHIPLPPSTVPPVEDDEDPRPSSPGNDVPEPTTAVLVGTLAVLLHTRDRRPPAKNV